MAIPSRARVPIAARSARPPGRLATTRRQPGDRMVQTAGKGTAKVRASVASRLAAVIASAALAAGAAGCSSGPGMQQQAAARFLSTYVRPEGRVVRLYQGRDTESEGQACGMLLAQALGKYSAF